MARITVHYLNGRTQTYYGGTSVYRGYLYIWKKGKRKGQKPIAKIRLAELHSLKKTGRKGIDISS